MKNKVVILGGGTGLSYLLSGLKQYPLDITAIVSVCDDGKSTGILREEFNIPAVGDVRKVLVSLSEKEPLITKLFNYRFNTTSDLDGHTVGNLLLTAATDVSGSLSDGIEVLSDVLNLKGRVVPLTEDNVVLMGQMEDDSVVEGEHNITLSKKKIKKVYYKEKPVPTKEAIKAIKEADLIVLSMGSIYTSLIPNLICDEIVDAIDNSSAKILYSCNMMTQPGETDGFSVTDHIDKINKYLGKRKIDVVIANNGVFDNKLVKKYESLEQKDPVKFNEEDFSKYNIEFISDNFITVSNNLLRHNTLKLGLYIFYYTMKLKVK